MESDTYVVVVRMTAASAVVELGRKLEHVKRVTLREYAIHRPNGGAIAPNVFKLQVRNQDFYPHEASNSNGPAGTVLVIDNAAVTHVVYDFHPRIISSSPKGMLSKLELALVLETGAAATFDSATFVFEFECFTPAFSPERVLWDDRQTPNFPSMQYDSRTQFAANSGMRSHQ